MFEYLKMTVTYFVQMTNKISQIIGTMLSIEWLSYWLISNVWTNTWPQFKILLLSVADPGLPGIPTLKDSAQTYYFAKILPKTAWKWKNLHHGRRAFLAPPLDPPMSRFIYTEWKQTRKRIIFVSFLWLLNMSLKFDCLWTYFKAMSVLLLYNINESLHSRNNISKDSVLIR